MISCFQLLCLIGESFEEYSEDICGAVVNIRNKGDKLSLWTKEAGRPDAILKIGYVISCSQLNSRFIWCIIQGWDDTLLSRLGTYHNTRDAIQYISRYSSCTLQLNENMRKRFKIYGICHCVTACPQWFYYITKEHCTVFKLHQSDLPYLLYVVFRHLCTFILVMQTKNS